MFTAPGFEGVAAAFARNFSEHGEKGAAFAAYHDGELVVDLWGGVADPASGRPWREDTLQLIFSGTKGMSTACVLLLAERGELDLDAPAVAYWPEFGARGKDRTTVMEVLSHQARLPGIQVPFADQLDPRGMAALLAAAEPLDDPRAAFTYHAITWGWLVGELVLRVDGRTIGAFFDEEFARPLGLEFWIGLPDELHPRVATMVPGPGILAEQPPTGDPLRDLVRNPLLTPDAPARWNSPEFRRAEFAAVGGHGTARSIARFYACLARGGELDGVRVLGEETVDRARREVRRGVEPLWDKPMAYGAGFELQTELRGFGPPTDAYGHAGAGGSRHGAWPAARVGFSYVMNEPRGMPDPRATGLLNALSDAL
ncbi:serine hydrolase domain-containing protein [Nonomuraea sediminis]|uniref:serine hydrolase domain-containing protein n=1 Tax=Nonomuraea sediminis TaxID=2835864 RepID=UPI001BDCB80D|nr:serine hydrolase domain-containing protein [Nonomuraea sediminis]